MPKMPKSIIDYFEERKTFSMNTNELRTLSSGGLTRADGLFNVDLAETVGATILVSMEGLSVSNLKFLKKQQVTNLTSSVYVSVDSEKIEINPQQLYQCLLSLALAASKSTQSSSVNSAPIPLPYSTKRFS